MSNSNASSFIGDNLDAVGGQTKNFVWLRR
ncbi:MAG: hypothetical protein ACI9TF_001967 [Paracrocinitomix sp.]